MYQLWGPGRNRPVPPIYILICVALLSDMYIHTVNWYNGVRHNLHIEYVYAHLECTYHVHMFTNMYLQYTRDHRLLSN